ncbi:MAG TPA: transglutaminase-like domain-containing protein, partial [Candidatus Dormibacteraeota bacterium]|nr:transglutaminase-like domain-containing protein [Candidatus Dormibacteraeota bacterium]
MSELALPLLLLIILGSLVAAAPPLTGLSSGQSSAGGRGVHPGAAAAWASLLFALALSGASAAVFAVTVLHQQGDFGILAALAGTLAAAAASRRLRRRRLAVPALLAVGLLVLLLVLYRLAIPGEGVAPLQLLGRELQGSDPAQLQALLLIGLCWVVGAWVGWFAIAEGSGLVASGLPLVAMLSDLINAPVGVEAKPVIPVLLASMAAVALIGSTHHLRQLPLWRSMSDLEKTPTVGRQLRVVVALAVGVAVLALALPPLSRTNISWRFFGGSQVNGPPLAYAESPSGYAIDVIPGGPIRNVSTQVLTYGTNAPFGSTYLQGEVFTDFSAGNWFPRYDTSVLLGSGSGLPYVGQASRLRDRRTIRLTVHYQGEASSAPPDVLYGGSPLRTPTAGPGYQVSGQAQGQRFLDVDQVTPEITDTTVISAGRSLTTYATVSTASPDQLERAGRRYPKWVLPLANLDGAGDPSQLAQVLTAAKQMAGSASNPYAEARNIQDTLRREETYTLDPPPAPNGTWPLLYFLNTSHRGYCQYFASAMGAMLRALGIPSRLAGGFDSGVRGIITEADAHVWVQAYFPHYGWVNFEPTPSVFTRIAHPTPGGVAASTGPTDSPTSAGAGG